ncbi:universal stress protein [Streptomyces gamaensis]|uniref:Universal stress protein n=1 Tax=Streptomyces gamaensis TaxID=1763542 RepID=A0ABW0ZBF1_9ACTN
MESVVKRVIVGAGGRPEQLAALRRAAGEARRHRAELHVVAAYGAGETCRSGPHSIGTLDLLVAQRAAATAVLREACAKALGSVRDDLSAVLVAVRGHPAHVLLQHADDQGDLLVVGIRPAGPVRGAFSRRVARVCLRHARCPVLVVPHHGGLTGCQ